MGYETVAQFRDIVSVSAKEFGVSASGSFFANEHEVRLIRKLRALFVESLVRPRGDFDKACWLITAEPGMTSERYAAAFFHGLELFARRTMEFYTKGSASVSTDEMWMARLLLAFNAQDYTSARYLLALRVQPAGLRRLRFLAHGLSSALFEDPQ